MGFVQRLVLWTALGAFVVFASAVLHHKFKTPEAVVISGEGQPTIGLPSAPVEAIIFEDFLCVECRSFNEKIFPRLDSKYISKGRLRYTLVPVSFLPGSKPLGNAALAVYSIAPQRFFAFAHAVFKKFAKPQLENSQRAILLEIAERVGGIDLNQLADAIDNRRYYAELDDNLLWGRKLLGVQFGTPALFINGVPTPTSSLRTVKARIDQAIFLADKESR